MTNQNKADISFVQVEGKPYSDIKIDNFGTDAAPIYDITRDNSLISAVTIMLMTDARATLEEISIANLFPKFPYDLRGWWGDSFRDTNIGSKLWLNRRRKATDQVLLKHKSYALEALLPLQSKGIVKSITIQANWVSKGIMYMNIQLVRPDNVMIQQSYTFLWTEVQNAIH